MTRIKVIWSKIWKDIANHLISVG